MNTRGQVDLKGFGPSIRKTGIAINIDGKGWLGKTSSHLFNTLTSSCLLAIQVEWLNRQLVMCVCSSRQKSLKIDMFGSHQHIYIIFEAVNLGEIAKQSVEAKEQLPNV